MQTEGQAKPGSQKEHPARRGWVKKYLQKTQLPNSLLLLDQNIETRLRARKKGDFCQHNKAKPRTSTRQEKKSRDYERSTGANLGKNT